MLSSLRSIAGPALSLFLLAGLAASSLAQAPATAPPPPAAAATQPKLDMTRVVEGDGGVLTLELAAWTLTPPPAGGPTVLLVGAVHVADRPFYDAMQTMLDQADVVLFEGVKPPGTGQVDPNLGDAAKADITRRRLKFVLTAADHFKTEQGHAPADWDAFLAGAGKRWRSVLEGCRKDAWGHEVRLESIVQDDGSALIALRSAGPDGNFAPADGDDLIVKGQPAKPGTPTPAPPAGPPPNVQQQLAKALGLTFQLDVMDSSKPNWRSSDLAVDEIQSRLEASGADAQWLFSMLDGKSMTSRLASLFLGFVASSPTMSATVKMMMVDILARSEEAMSASGPMARLGPIMKVIIEDRNAVVVRDLKAIAAGEPAVKTVAIFYGAGHMGHMVSDLRDLGYTPGDVLWTPAIRVDPKDAGMTPEQAQAMRKMIQGVVEAQQRRDAK